MALRRLVTRLLDESGAVHYVRVRKERLDLDEVRRVHIEPDLVFASGADVLAVADTKYKLLDDTGRFPNADAYQLVTYCARLELSVGHLIYAAGEPRPEPYDICGTEIRLVIHSVDLGLPISRLEDRVHELFSIIVPGSEASTLVLV